MTRRIPVHLPHHRYDVLVEPGALARAGSLIRVVAPHARAAVLADEAVLNLHGSVLNTSLSEAGYRLLERGFQSGEAQKHAGTLGPIYAALVEAGLERKSPIIAFGGGVAGDLIGFVAATYLRGVPFIQIPTTLLAMVDASVGGKVGYNLPQGKNLVGAFYQPQLVLIDPLVLTSLPDREFRAGLAECVKHAVLADETLFAWTEAHAEEILAKDATTLTELIARNVQIKAEIVVADERELGIRAHLNLGHTFGHAIESTTGYGTFLHGEAVALGLCAATALSVSRGSCADSVLDRVQRLLTRFGLPVRASVGETETLVHAMAADKKVQDGAVRLILPTAIGSVCIINDASHAELTSAWRSVSDD